MKPNIRLAILIFNSFFSIFQKVNDPDGIKTKQPGFCSVICLFNEPRIYYRQQCSGYEPMQTFLGICSTKSVQFTSEKACTSCELFFSTVLTCTAILKFHILIAELHCNVRVVSRVQFKSVCQSDLQIFFLGQFLVGGGHIVVFPA